MRSWVLTYVRSTDTRISRKLMYLPVVAFIPAVDVVEDIRLDHRVIQGGVKRSRLCVGPARYLDLRQLFVPGRFRIGANLVKIPTGKLGSEILSSTFDRDVGDRDLQKNLIAASETKM